MPRIALFETSCPHEGPTNELATASLDTLYASARATRTCSTCVLARFVVCTRIELVPTADTSGTSFGATEATASIAA